METQTAQTTDSKLREFFIDQLEDLLWAEKKLVKTLPKMQEAATSSQLKDAFGNHLTETQNHVSRLEQVFGINRSKPGFRNKQGIIVARV